MEYPWQNFKFHPTTVRYVQSCYSFEGRKAKANFEVLLSRLWCFFVTTVFFPYEWKFHNTFCTSQKQKHCYYGCWHKLFRDRRKYVFLKGKTCLNFDKDYENCAIINILMKYASVRNRNVAGIKRGWVIFLEEEKLKNRRLIKERKPFLSLISYPSCLYYFPIVLHLTQ